MSTRSIQRIMGTDKDDNAPAVEDHRSPTGQGALPIL